MLSVVLYKGYHSPVFDKLLEECLLGEDSLLIVCPPRFSVEELEDIFSYLPCESLSLVDEINQQRRLIKNESFKKSNNEWDKNLKIGLFTSGTSSRHKKMVLYTEKNFMSSIESIYSLFKESVNIFCYPQPYHIFGLSLGYIFTRNKEKNLITYNGAYSNQSHEAWVKANDQYSDLITLGTPTHFKDLISYVENKELTLKNTYSSIIGGALVNKALWLDVKESLKIQEPSVGYGCTEASPGTFHLKPGLCPESDGDVGFILDGVDLRFNEDKTYTFSGANLATTYIDQLGIHKIKEFNVLDILDKSPSGHFHYCSRKEEVINRGGEKFFPEEIEQFFLNHHGVLTVCLKENDERLGEDFVLLVENSAETLDSSSIQDIFYNKFKRRVEKDNILISSVLPINDNQKVDRRRCLELVRQKRG